MASYVKLLLKISRWRFWLYLGGTFMVGYAFGVHTVEQFYSWRFFLLLFTFLIPANVWLYGINDIFDQDTDAENKKKDHREHRYTNETAQVVKRTVAGALVAGFILAAFTLHSYSEWLLYFLFYILAWLYSGPPARFKAKPFVDSVSNVLYALPGILGYVISSQNFPPLTLIIAAWCWTAAMHLFSAIPDIQVDQAAGVRTTAVVLGKRNALLVCTFLWLVFWVFLIMVGKSPLFIIGIIYPLIPAYIACKKTTDIESVYWKFPWINASIGMLAFWYAMIQLWN